MAKGLVSDTNLTAIANAIRAKNGETDTYTPAEMAQAISDIPTSQVDQTTALQWMLNNKTDYTGIAAGLTTLTELPEFTQPAAAAQQRNYSGAFSGCSSLRTVSGIDTGEDASSVVSLGGCAEMFQGCSSLTAVPDFSNARVSNADHKGCSGMFYGCSNLTTINLSSGFMSLAATTAEVFRGCSKLTTINNNNSLQVSQYSVTCDLMFASCYALTRISLTGYPLGGDRAASVGASSMFSNCRSLQTVLGVSNWLKNVYIATNMFYGCSSLQTINLGSLQNCTSCNAMFQGCTSLLNASFSDTSSVKIFARAFSGCSSLVTAPSFSMAAVQGSYQHADMYKDCPALSTTSLNNILSSLATATKITSNKTLKYIGLSSTQATTCTGLSNWAALSAAGWTTGY